MAEHSLYPAAVVINYRTIYAPHTMTLPLRDWSAISEGHPAGTFLNWEGGQTDADDYMQAFVTLLLPFFADDTVFENYVIYTYEDEDAPARPQAGGTLGTLTPTGTAVIPASQATWNFKTSDFGTFKLVLLDTQVSASFGPDSALVSPADDDAIALRTAVLASDSCLAGRDGFKITTWVRITYTLNEKLRASYHLD